MKEKSRAIEEFVEIAKNIENIDQIILHGKEENKHVSLLLIGYNIAADKVIIPELLQAKCNPKDIFNKVDEFLSNPELSRKQINEYQEIIRNFKTKKSSEIASSVLINCL